MLSASRNERKQYSLFGMGINRERVSIQVEGKQVNRSSAMAVSVEIKTGPRRVIEYLLSPLLKSLKKSWRER